MIIRVLVSAAFLVSTMLLLTGEVAAAVVKTRAKQLFFCNLTESDLRSDSPVV